MGPTDSTLPVYTLRSWMIILDEMPSNITMTTYRYRLVTTEKHGRSICTCVKVSIVLFRIKHFFMRFLSVVVTPVWYLSSTRMCTSHSIGCTANRCIAFVGSWSTTAHAIHHLNLFPMRRAMGLISSVGFCLGKYPPPPPGAASYVCLKSVKCD